VLVWLSTRRHLHDLAPAAVIVRPPWLPAAPFLALHRHRRAAFVLLPVSLAAGALLPPPAFLRLAIALAVSAYHLVESSATGRHGEFPLLYCAWAMCLPAPCASAASLGTAAHFVLSAGVAKLRVGGLRGWAAAGTMRAYLQIYRGSASAQPVSPRLSRAIGSRAWATRAAGVGTLALEVALVPGLLLAPPRLRWLGWLMMLFLHLGIGLIMSFKVGLVFLTTLPAYYIGFSCNAPVGSLLWLAASLLAWGPTLVSVATGRPIPESWPLSPCALFMWSGPDARWLAAATMTGETRLVLFSEVLFSEGLVGRRVLGVMDRHGKDTEGGAAAGGAGRKGGVADGGVNGGNAGAERRGEVEGRGIASGEGEAGEGLGARGEVRPCDCAAHDGVLRVVGFTLLRAEGALLPLLCGGGEPSRGGENGAGSRGGVGKGEGIGSRGGVAGGGEIAHAVGGSLGETGEKLGTGGESGTGAEWQRAVAMAVEGWLRGAGDGRLIERATGKPLRRACFVRVNGRGCVVSVVE
jgi:hypothetical protein